MNPQWRTTIFGSKYQHSGPKIQYGYRDKRELNPKSTETHKQILRNLHTQNQWLHVTQSKLEAKKKISILESKEKF